jgi:hypothetical protein
MSKSCALPKSMFPLKFKVKSPSHALALARALVGPFRRWTTDMLATDDPDATYTGEISPKDARAQAFCALGALRRVNTKHEKRAEYFLQKAAAFMRYGTDIEGFNQDDIFEVNDRVRNKETHGKVLKMFTKAIQLAKKAEKEIGFRGQLVPRR